MGLGVHRAREFKKRQTSKAAAERICLSDSRVAVTADAFISVL